MSEPYERLDSAMNARRLDLRMNWREVSTAAGISYEALRGIRRGDYRPSELTARALDDALRWERGSVEAILAGGDPMPIRRHAPDDDDFDPIAQLERMEDADPRILSILRNPVFTDEERAWLIEALPPRREPRQQRSDTG